MPRCWLCPSPPDIKCTICRVLPPKYHTAHLIDAYVMLCLTIQHETLKSELSSGHWARRRKRLMLREAEE